MMSTSNTYYYPGSPGAFLAAMYSQLEESPYRDYLLIDRGDHLIFRYQPRSIRPFGNDTGLSLSIQVKEIEPGKTEVVAREAYPWMLIGILMVFALVCVVYTIYLGELDFVFLIAMLFLPAVYVLNRSYQRRMQAVFSEIMQQITSQK